MEGRTKGEGEGCTITLSMRMRGGGHAAGLQGRDREAKAVRDTAVSIPISTPTCTHTCRRSTEKTHWQINRLPDKVQDDQLNSNFR